MDTSDSIANEQDHYTQPDGAIEDPPKDWRATLKYLGPSVINSATIVGSGEIILTASRRCSGIQHALVGIVFVLEQIHRSGGTGTICRTER